MIETIAPALVDSLTVLQDGSQTTVNHEPALRQGAAAAIGIGLAAIGAGYAERGIGAAAVGALAEDSISTGIGIVLTVLPETLVIFALVALFV
ncbi:F0F1 ATP synthase subunit C [Natronoarchaeum rubrum]|uniref:F0F1 ATP synthase subunit C n=1 Tax=Natronoarchaeum rubrum TaxID=755311 RepID=UPI002111ED5B|nr:F0F1 ATP synthase subunit C [Natronoarchaeum rubrum]HMB51441.1 F0F1 ATP synthase subunit C [Natronoarchaeum rubrum]